MGLLGLQLAIVLEIDNVSSPHWLSWSIQMPVALSSCQSELASLQSSATMK